MAPVADTGLLEVRPVAAGDDPADLRAVGEDDEHDPRLGRRRIGCPPGDAGALHQIEIAVKHAGWRRPVGAQSPRAAR
jgi:hypothetical protein